MEVKDFKKKAKEGKAPELWKTSSLPQHSRVKLYINSQCLFAFKAPDNRTGFTK